MYVLSSGGAGSGATLVCAVSHGGDGGSVAKSCPSWQHHTIFPPTVQEDSLSFTPSLAHAICPLLK